MGSGVAAYFDVDGTIAHTSSVTPLLWYRRRRGLLSDQLWLASLAVRVPAWLLTYRISNAAGIRAVYRSYKGFDAGRARADVPACFEECIRPRIFQDAVKSIEDFKRRGVKIVLVTGALDFVMQPLAAMLGAELIAPGLVESGGVFTGELTRPPMMWSAKYVAVCRHATREGIDLTASHAFGNEYSDLNMLHAVGHPVAVRPDGRLRKTAVKNGWEIAAWK